MSCSICSEPSTPPLPHPQAECGLWEQDISRDFLGWGRKDSSPHGGKVPAPVRGGMRWERENGRAQRAEAAGVSSAPPRISTSAKEGLGLWKKADFKGRTPLSFSQTRRHRSMYGKVETSKEKWNVRDLAVFFFTQVKIQQIAFRQKWVGQAVGSSMPPILFCCCKKPIISK